MKTQMISVARRGRTRTWGVAREGVLASPTHISQDDSFRERGIWLLETLNYPSDGERVSMPVATEKARCKSLRWNDKRQSEAA